MSISSDTSTNLLKTDRGHSCSHTRITYKRGSEAQAEAIVPFTILLLSDLSGDRERTARGSGRLVPLTADGFEEFLKSISPRLKIAVPDERTADGVTESLPLVLTFQSLNEFMPTTIVKRVGLNRDAALNRETLGADRLAEIECNVALRLDTVLHHESFNKLHASWLGLYNLLIEAKDATDVQIEVYDIKKKELFKQLSSNRLEQLDLYHQTVTERLETFEADPITLLVTDFDFGLDDYDLIVLQQLAALAAKLQAPLVASASPTFFHQETFAKIARMGSLSKMCEGDRYRSWRGFRKHSNSRYVFLTLPTVRARSPYSCELAQMHLDGTPEHIHYSESCSPRSELNVPNLAASYFLAGRAISSFRMSGWVSDLNPLKTHNMIFRLPEIELCAEDGACRKPALEADVPQRVAQELRDLGFCALISQKGTQNAAFFYCPSCHKLAKETDFGAVLTVSRFSHTLRALLRYRSLDFEKSEKLEQFVHDWLEGYSIDLANPSAEHSSVNSSLPLRDFQISVLSVGASVRVKCQLLTTLCENEWHFEYAINTRTAKLPSSGARVETSGFYTTVSVGGKNKSRSSGD